MSISPVVALPDSDPDDACPGVDPNLVNPVALPLNSNPGEPEAHPKQTPKNEINKCTNQRESAVFLIFLKRVQERNAERALVIDTCAWARKYSCLEQQNCGKRARQTLPERGRHELADRVRLVGGDHIVILGEGGGGGRW